MATLSRPPVVWPVVPLAMAPVPGVPKEMTGAVQPAPPFVIVTPVTAPLATVATAVGATAQPVTVTLGALVYPLPPDVTLIAVSGTGSGEAVSLSLSTGVA